MSKDEIENPMVLKRGYGIIDQQSIPVIRKGVCEGCKEEIIYYQDTLPVEDGEIHDDWHCAYLYIKEHFS